MQKDNNDVVMVILDKPRQLWCGHRALKKITSMLGKGLSEIDESTFNPADLEVILFSLLQRDFAENFESFQLSDMEELLDQAPRYGEVITAVSAAFAAAFGEPDGQSAEEAKNAQRAAGIGKRASK